MFCLLGHHFPCSNMCGRLNSPFLFSHYSSDGRNQNQANKGREKIQRPNATETHILAESEKRAVVPVLQIEAISLPLS